MMLHQRDREVEDASEESAEASGQERESSHAEEKEDVARQVIVSAPAAGRTELRVR